MGCNSTEGRPQPCAWPMAATCLQVGLNKGPKLCAFKARSCHSNHSAAKRTCLQAQACTPLQLLKQADTQNHRKQPHYALVPLTDSAAYLHTTYAWLSSCKVPAAAKKPQRVMQINLQQKAGCVRHICVLTTAGCCPRPSTACGWGLSGHQQSCPAVLWQILPALLLPHLLRWRVLLVGCSNTEPSHLHTYSNTHTGSGWLFIMTKTCLHLSGSFCLSYCVS